MSLARWLLAVPAALLVLPAPLLAQGSPGLRVKWVIEGVQGGAQEMTLYTAERDGSKSRLEIGSQAILVSSGDDRIMIMPEQKMWMDLAELEGLGARMGMPAGAGGERSGDVADMKATGESGSFAGHDCTYYRFTQDEVVTEVCAAKGLGWGMGPNPGGGMMGARGGMPGRGGRGGMGGVASMNSEMFRQMQEMFADGFFVLEVRQLRDGRVTMRMYASELEKQSVSDELFSTRGPEGYEKMSMFGRGRGGG